MTAIFKENSAPPTPPAGYVAFYCKTDGLLYYKDDTGTELPIRPVGGGTGDLLSDGTVPLVADWDVGSFVLTALRFVSDVTTGTAPLTVASTTVVTNLNADKLDGADLIDEDDMVSDSDTAVPTQQSVKAYVDANGGIAASLFDANTILKADSDDTPAALTVGEQTLVGRITAGSIAALTATQVRTLLNVEDGADVTDATNVEAAGALMDSEVTNLADVKAFDPTDYATAAQGTFAVSEIFTADIPTVTDQDYVLWYDAPFAGTVTMVRTESTSGTCTLTGKVNSTALGGTANSVSSTAQEQAHASTNTFVKGDVLQFTVSSNSSCLNLSVAFYITRTS